MPHLPRGVSAPSPTGNRGARHTDRPKSLGAALIAPSGPSGIDARLDGILDRIEARSFRPYREDAGLRGAKDEGLENTVADRGHAVRCRTSRQPIRGGQILAQCCRAEAKSRWPKITAPFWAPRLGTQILGRNFVGSRAKSQRDLNEAVACFGRGSLPVARSFPNHDAPILCEATPR